MADHRTTWTTRADGDFADPDRASLPARVAVPAWTWLRQVHGARVVIVTAPGEHAGAEADAAVTTVAGAALAVRTADCAPVAFHSSGAGPPVTGVAHAGWKGLEAGVLAATVAAMRDLGADRIEATLGPCIHPECYEFGEPDLSRLVDRFGPATRGATTAGRPAFDLPAAVAAAVAELDVVLDVGAAACTACHPDRYFSYRARRDAGRQATFAWISG